MKLEGDVSFEGDSATTFNITSQGSAAAVMRLIDLNNETRKFNIESGKTLRLDPIIQNGMLYKKGSGTLELRGANTYEGGTYIEEGRVVLNGAGLIGPASSTVTLESAGILDLGGTNQIIAQLEGSGVVQNTRASSGTNTLTIASDTKNSTFTGHLKDI